MKQYKTILFFIVNAIFVLLSSCQWQDTLEDPSMFMLLYGTATNDYATDIVQTMDGGFAILGRQTDTVYNREHAVLLRADPHGKLLWQQHYHYDTTDCALYDLMLRPDGNFMMAGVTSNGGNGLTDGWIVHALDDEKGTMVSSKSYGIPQCNKSLNAITRLPRGKFAAVGEIENGFWLLIIDGEGGIVLERSWGLNTGAKANSVMLGNDNMIIACGQSGSNQLQRVAWNEWGDLIWADSTGGGLTVEEEGIGIEMLSNGNMVVAGNTDINGSNPNVFLRVYDADSVVHEWTSTGSKEDLVVSRNIIRLNDDSLFVVGSTTSFNREQKDIYTIMVNIRDNTSTQRTYGSRFNETAISVIQLKNNTGFAICGHTDSFEFTGDHDIFLLRLDADGRLVKIP
jgi:hypothetical protein